MQDKFIPTKAIGREIDNMVTASHRQRLNFERRWYDNNFFDDGFHFRYVSRTTGRIVDLAERNLVNIPERAIPKASRQIRGIANLLLGPDYVPVVYPDEIAILKDEQKAKLDAQRIGWWIENEIEEQMLITKLMQMVILTCKHGVSYLQVWDDENGDIKTKVYDAFDIYLKGQLDNIEDSPYVIKAIPRSISEIKNDQRFDKDVVKQIHPDNKYASSEIKEAYMQSRYGGGRENERAATLIQKEGFIKEIVSETNRVEVRKTINSTKNDGDIVMRHVFTAGGITLFDEYVDLDSYPFVDFRMEPGPIYQVPLIERFIPANKSLDIAMSRVERYINTMITGTWLKRRGEDFEITNVPGGQVLEYETTPPVQGSMASMPSSIFNFIQEINKIIEEQGASTSALGQVPQGVKSGVAIESLKATEFANLKIPSNQLKQTVQRVGQKMIDIASDFVLTRQSFKKGDNEGAGSFSVIGERGATVRKEKGMDLLPDTVIISKDTKVDVEVESGLGFTMEGKKQTMQQIVTFMETLVQNQLINSEAVKVVVKKFLDTFQFGSTQEFMKALDEGTQPGDLTEDQIAKMKVAIAEVLKDTGAVGQTAERQQVDSTKVGLMEALKDLEGGQNAAT